jgi:hypothetical protein
VTTPAPVLDRAPLGLVFQGPAPSLIGQLWVSRTRGLSVILSIDGGHRHLSIASPARYPSWDEILRVRNWYFPEEMEVVMVLARRSEYVNLHPTCFHLWESACGREGR